MESESLKIYFDSLAHTSTMKSVKLANKTLNYSSLVGLSYFLSKSPKPKLEELDLSYCLISGRELQIMMKHMPFWKLWRKKKNIFPQIQKLKLAGNLINGNNSIDVFNDLISKIQGILSLDLTKNILTAYDLTLLSESFKKVEYELNLSHNRFQENFPEQIDFLLHLKILSLSYNNLTRNSIITIANSIEKNPYWSTLDLSCNNIDDEDLIILLKALQKNSNLQSLNLAANKITDNGLVDMEKIYNSLQLKEINLSNNEIGLVGLIYLFPMALKSSLPIKQIYLENINYYDDNYSRESFEINFELNLKTVEVLSVENSIFLSDFITKSLITANSLIDLNLSDSILDENIIPFTNFLINSNTLKYLKIRNIGIGSLKYTSIVELMKGIKGCVNLELLDISKNKLGKHITLLEDKIDQLSHLRVLNISSNLLENEHSFSVSHIINETLLEELNISNNLFSYIAFEEISDALVQNSTIKILNIGKMHLDVLSLIPLGKVLVRNTTLENLDLSETVFNSTSILELNRKEKGNLNELCFNYMKFESFQYSILINMLNINSGITVVNLEACLFIRLNLNKLIKCVTRLKRLRYLNFSNISFTDVEISELLIRLREHLILEQLILKNVDFREKSMNAFGKFLKYNKSVKMLDLSSNNLSKTFFHELKEAMELNKTLEDLKINESQIKDDNFLILLEILEKAPKIKNIEISKNLLSYESLNLLFSREIHSENNLMNRLVLDGNPFNFEDPLKSLHPLKYNRIIELNLMKSLKNTPLDCVKKLLKFLSENKQLVSLNLNDNGLNDEILSLLSDSLTKDSSISFLSIAHNGFSLIGIAVFFSNLKKNTKLFYLDISENIKRKDESKIFCDHLQDSLLINKTLHIIDVSKNCYPKYINSLLKSIFSTNKNFIFLNENWYGIKSSMAIKVIESYQNFYLNFINDKAPNSQKLRIQNLYDLTHKFKKIDFSRSSLDDDFCLFFSDNIHKMPFLEEFIFTENYNITISGLKNIYVGLVLHKNDTNLDRIYFEKINIKNFLNNGIAASISEWGRYGEVTSKAKKLLQKVSYVFFSKLITVNNKFQFADQFSEFTDKFSKGWILFFYLLNFIVMMTLSITLPIVSQSPNCGNGHAYYSHVTYSVYVFITMLFEFTFWMYYKCKLRDYSENEKDLKREVFISDVLFLFSSVGEKFNLYLDVCFITISHTCGQPGVSYASVATVVLKYFISTVMAFKSMIKLFTAIMKENHVAILNLITKLALIEYFFLIGDILDRYVPGNVKRFRRILGIKLQRSIFISTNILLASLKFFLEDLPQSIIQCFYVFQRNRYGDEWIIFVNIAKNFISLIVSFYSVVSLRPSYIEQADFDERLSLLRFLNKNEKLSGVRKDRRTTSLLQSNFNLKTIDEELKNLRSTINKERTETININDEKKFKSFFEIGKSIFEGKYNT